MELTRRKFLQTGVSVVAASAGLSMLIPKNALGQIGEGVSLNSSLSDTVASKTFATFKKKDFVPYIGTKFTISSGISRPSTVTLSSVDDLTNLKANQGLTNGFSLLFSVGKRQALAQGTYLVNHFGLGSFQLLLVPVLVGESNPTFFYEAIFNYLV